MVKLCRDSIAGSAEYVEEQWRFYGFCDSFEQARYIAVQGLSAGLGEPSCTLCGHLQMMPLHALHWRVACGTLHVYAYCRRYTAASMLTCRPPWYATGILGAYLISPSQK